MAPLPPNNTARFRVHYTVIGNQHSMQIRSGVSPASLGSFINALYTNLGVDVFATVIDFVDWAPAGSDIFNPVTTGIEGNTYGSGAGATENIPWALTFIGRTSGGRRVRFAVFGYKSLSSNYRVTAGEQASIDGVITLLQSVGSGVVGIDNIAPVWKTYADVQVNDHWLKVVRP
jgi:hypothetical protein